MLIGLKNFCVCFHILDISNDQSLYMMKKMKNIKSILSNTIYLYIYIYIYIYIYKLTKHVFIIFFLYIMLNEYY